MLCSFCTGEKKKIKNQPKPQQVLCFLRAVVPPHKTILEGRLGPPDRRGAVGVGRRGGCAAACQPPAAACVRQMLANQAAPKTSDMALAWAFVYQEESLRLALQTLGALQIPLLSPRLPLGAFCPALGIPFESLSRRRAGRDDADTGSFAFVKVCPH